MHKRTSLLLDPWFQGTICGLLSAIGYTVTNALLRSVSHELDPFWVSGVKAIPTALLLGPWLFWQWRRGELFFPSRKTLWLVLVASLIAQLGGNVAFQWALSQVGLAVTVPLALGGMIVAAAVLARILLHEPITLRAAAALTLLISAIVLLSLGAEDVSADSSNLPSKTINADNPAPTWGLFLGVAAGIGSGFAYAILNVVIRSAMTQGASLPFTLSTVSLTGIVSLGLLSYLRLGWTGMAATTPYEWQMMIAAGVGNALSFIALTISLRLTSVVYVNALNATQAAMAAFAGVLFFQEMLSPWLMLGLTLTITGLLLMRQGKSSQQLPAKEDV